MVNSEHLKVLIIIPCFNEAQRINRNSFLEFSKHNSNINFLFVDDGSTDNTSIVLKELSNKSHLLDYKTLTENCGKGEAIRRGILSNNGNLNTYDFVGYMDADLSVPLEEINYLLNALRARKNIEFILSIRVGRLGAEINRNFYRHYLGRIFATFVSLLLKEPIYDSQCGAKLIHTSHVKSLFDKPFISTWLFDVELIARWKISVKNYDQKILEYPLNNWQEIKGSKLKLSHFLLAPIELIKIWSIYRKAIQNVDTAKQHP
ncbi:glycosyltransferase [Changchengzhania lutea]|uniref:glycosyltransferase n=1 Tax=Changchengzhania lutea TaxID=2049305 RepID=UPI00115EA31E|nr:glycosyltransferase [Changchengzhania lutea]